MRLYQDRILVRLVKVKAGNKFSPEFIANVKITGSNFLAKGSKNIEREICDSIPVMSHSVKKK